VQILIHDINQLLNTQSKDPKYPPDQITLKERAYKGWRKLMVTLRQREDKSLELQPPHDFVDLESDNLSVEISILAEDSDGVETSGIGIRNT
jgi:hypothetical protein